MQSVKKLAKCGMNAMVNHSALLLAKADVENYDLSKYRKRVIAELDDDNYSTVNLDNPSGTVGTHKPSEVEFQRLMNGTLTIFHFAIHFVLILFHIIYL